MNTTKTSDTPLDDVTLAALLELGCIDDLDARVGNCSGRRRTLELLEMRIAAGEAILEHELPIFGEDEEVVSIRRRTAVRQKGRELLLRLA